MSKASDAGKSFLAGVLAKLPENLRTQAETALLSAEAESALEVLGTGALGQSEINRKFDELRSTTEALDQEKARLEAIHGEQTRWWTANEPKIREYDTIKPEYDRLKEGKVADPINPTADQLTAMRKELNDQLVQVQREGVNLMAFMQTLGLKHYREFGEEPDLQGMLADRKIGTPLGDGRTYGLTEAYAAKYGDQVKARAQKAEDDRINKLADERVAERMKGMQQPFPLRNQASVLDALEAPETAPKHDLESATALYEQLQAARG